MKVLLLLLVALVAMARGQGVGPPEVQPPETTAAPELEQTTAAPEQTTQPEEESSEETEESSESSEATTAAPADEPEDYTVKYKGNRYIEYSIFACEGEVTKLACPKNHFIYIYDTYWGRGNDYSCTRDDNADFTQRCDSDDAEEIVKDDCEGRNNCQFVASASKFGWLCNTPKYLKITYQCYSPLYHALMCQEYGQMEISCPAGQHVDIIDAMWGRASMDVCPHNNIVDDDCNEPNTKEMITEMCTGRASCMMDATVVMFGNPCPGTVKYLEVDYICTECMNAHEVDADCEFWAALGACSNDDKPWMEANCRRTCFDCGTPEQEAASCINYAGNSYCEYNAGRGQCDSNPTWMHAYCKRACLKCDNKTPCKNTQTDEKCDNYATTTGQCLDNVYWMHQHCTKSCWECDTGIIECKDRNSRCEEWANNFECQYNPGYMIPFCTKSCTGCTKDPECVNEHHSNSDCEYWASIGECERNAAYMYKKCWKSCLNCGEPAPCINEFGDDEQCEIWKQNGDCEDSMAWMTAKCKKTCLQCDLRCINMQDDADCERWAASGECELNPIWMHQYCLKTCQKCDDPLECENKAGDATCSNWAHEGECYTNPYWMYINCRLSCTRCSSLNNVHPCVDLNEKCSEWADNDECISNPSYMIPNCRKSCTVCDTEGRYIEIEDDFTLYEKMQHVGNPPTPGETLAFTRGSTFLLPEAFPTYGRLLSVNGFFETTSGVHIQVWRHNSTGWFTTYDEELTAKHRNTAQTHTSIWPCVNIWTGDRLGFTTYGDVSPIAANMDAMSVFKKHKFHDAGTNRGFIDLALPYKFSLGAEFEVDGNCS